MTRLFLSVFYMLLAYVTFSSGRYLFSQPSLPSDFVMFAKPFASLLFSDLNLSILFTTCLVCLLICITSPRPLFRILGSLFFLVLISIKHSYGKINHSEHIWIISSILVCFISSEQKIHSKRNLTVIRLIQSILLSFYFISGLWKIRYLGFNIDDWSKSALESISYSIAEGRGPWIYIENIMMSPENSWIITLGFTSVLLIQLSTIIPVITQKYIKLWGFGILLFHFSTGMTLGIWFSPTALAVLLFLIFTQNLIESRYDDNLPNKISV